MDGRDGDEILRIGRAPQAECIWICTRYHMDSDPAGQLPSDHASVPIHSSSVPGPATTTTTTTVIRVFCQSLQRTYYFIGIRLRAVLVIVRKWVDYDLGMSIPAIQNIATPASNHLEFLCAYS